ncbi:MAG TPA: hydroxymethylbilane synthase [Candidatus Dormibacteraeota bacterium]
MGTPPAIATRSSRLALVQAEAVRSAVARANPGLELSLLEVTSRGDELADVSLESVEGTGFFTDAVEQALLTGTAVLGAHSLKDIPTELDRRFAIAAVLARGDPRDVLVSPYGGLDRLPAGARIGTDASRRREQLALLRPDLVFLPVRGNVPTRLEKLDRGDYDGLVLAAAGLLRLGLGARITEYLETDRCLPAPGQGAIAVESLSDGEWVTIAARADDVPTSTAVRAERAFLAALGGGCATPVGGLAEVEGEKLRLRGVVVEGGQALRVEVVGRLSEPQAPERLGFEAARRLRRP